MTDTTPELDRQILTFTLEGEIFALQVVRVHEVLDLPPVSYVPNAHAFAPGLINVRGNVVPIVDLRRKFGMEGRDLRPDARVVVAEIAIAGQPTLVGLIADDVDEVIEADAALIDQIPRIGTRWRPEFIQGVAKRADALIIILDLDRIFAEDGARDDAAA